MPQRKREGDETCSSKRVQYRRRDIEEALGYSAPRPPRQSAWKRGSPRRKQGSWKKECFPLVFTEWRGKPSIKKRAPLLHLDEGRKKKGNTLVRSPREGRGKRGESTRIFSPKRLSRNESWGGKGGGLKIMKSKNRGERRVPVCWSTKRRCDGLIPL